MRLAFALPKLRFGGGCDLPSKGVPPPSYLTIGSELSEDLVVPHRMDGKPEQYHFSILCFSGDSALHSLCVCIALHLRIDFSNMNIEYTGILWKPAMHYLFPSRKVAL